MNYDVSQVKIVVFTVFLGEIKQNHVCWYKKEMHNKLEREIRFSSYITVMPFHRGSDPSYDVQWSPVSVIHAVCAYFWDVSERSSKQRQWLLFLKPKRDKSALSFKLQCQNRQDIFCEVNVSELNFNTLIR